MYIVTADLSSTHHHFFTTGLRLIETVAADQHSHAEVAGGTTQHQPTDHRQYTYADGNLQRKLAINIGQGWPAPPVGDHHGPRR